MMIFIKASNGTNYLLTLRQPEEFIQAIKDIMDAGCDKVEVTFRSGKAMLSLFGKVREE